MTDEARMDDRVEEIREAFSNDPTPQDVVRDMIHRLRREEEGGERTGSVTVTLGHERCNGYAAAMEIVLDRLQAAEERAGELEGVVEKIPNAARYVLGTIGHGGAIKINDRGEFDYAIHGGRRGSAIRFMEQILKAAREALREGEE